MKGFLVVGARPNFMKAAALYKPLNEHFDVSLVHTGQHYDEEMSKIFFDGFDQLDISFGFSLSEKGHAKQTAEIMVKFDDLCETEKPDFVIVVGDVNSTLACALVAKKRDIIVIHVEGGLRSFDQTMPEEVNRVMVDHISDYLFVTERAASDNLIEECVLGKQFLTGDVMIDVLKSNLSSLIGSGEDNYCVYTIHRQKNVQDKEILRDLLETMSIISDKYKVIFPIHPNTKQLIYKYGYDYLIPNVDIRKPMPYLEFLSYVKNAKFVVTDSGSLQTECNYMDVPCLVLRENTERVNAVALGCCKLVGFNSKKLLDCVDSISSGDWKEGYLSYIDDGRAAERIVDVLKEKLDGNKS